MVQEKQPADVEEGVPEVTLTDTVFPSSHINWKEKFGDLGVEPPLERKIFRQLIGFPYLTN